MVPLVSISQGHNYIGCANTGEGQLGHMLLALVWSLPRRPSDALLGPQMELVWGAPTSWHPSWPGNEELTLSECGARAFVILGLLLWSLRGFLGNSGGWHRVSGAHPGWNLIGLLQNGREVGT